jgi:hypothetical protein
MGTSPSAPRIVTRDATVCGSVSKISLAAAAAAAAQLRDNNILEEERRMLVLKCLVRQICSLVVDNQASSGTVGNLAPCQLGHWTPLLHDS